MTRKWGLDDLPLVEGKYSPGVLLQSLTWFQVGGAADVLYRPKDVSDLQTFLAERPQDLPFCVVGVGSNLLVRDGGIPGVVIRLMGTAFTGIQINESVIEVGAGCLDRTVALTARDQGLGGLEFLVGIPGTIGGALRMNAGAYGQEIKDVLVWAEVLSPEGILHRLTPAEMGFSYRQCSLPDDWIFVRTGLQGYPASIDVVGQKLQDILTQREATQPTKGRTGGSTFHNPKGMKAWELIDRAGCRGLMRGSAQVSEKHCNFLLNIGGATAQQIEELAEDVRTRVKATTGITLVWEIVRMGVRRA